MHVLLAQTASLLVVGLPLGSGRPVQAQESATGLPINPDSTRAWVERLRSLGTTVVGYTEYPGVGHNSWEAEALNARRARALKAANWSVYRGPFLRRVKVFPRVVADTLVRPSDLESANLVLFGTKETNHLIARFSDRLPIHLDPVARGYGLAYVYPIGGHYVLISSGLPWWKAGATSDESRSPFAGAVVAFELMGLQDYLLFEKSSGDVIVEGRFDNEWRVPAADAEEMQSTGVVTVAADAVSP